MIASTTFAVTYFFILMYSCNAFVWLDIVKSLHVSKGAIWIPMAVGGVIRNFTGILYLLQWMVFC